MTTNIISNPWAAAPGSPVSGRNLKDRTGRADTCHSSLDAPRYAPYADGKGRLDIGMTQIPMAKDSDLAKYLFDIDKFWPFYLNRKHELHVKCRNTVYRDINKVKLKNTYDDLRWFIQSDVMELKHPFGGLPFGTATLTGQPCRPLNPNHSDWETLKVTSPIGTQTEAYFQRIDRFEHPTTGISYVYRNYFGGPLVPVWTRGFKYTLEEIAFAVQEDLYVLRRRDDGWSLRAASVCFPSYWNLADHIGKPLSFFHDNVPPINSNVEKIIRRKMDNLRPDMPAERLNWMITTTAGLHQPRVREPEEKLFVGGEMPITTADHIARRLFVRVNREVMLKLHSGDIFCTNRTYIDSLSTVLRYPDLTVGLYNSIRATPDDLLHFRGIDRYKEQILDMIRLSGHLSADNTPTHKPWAHQPMSSTDRTAF